MKLRQISLSLLVAFFTGCISAPSGKSEEEMFVEKTFPTLLDKGMKVCYCEAAPQTLLGFEQVSMIVFTKSKGKTKIFCNKSSNVARPCPRVLCSNDKRLLIHKDSLDDSLNEALKILERIGQSRIYLQPSEYGIYFSYMCG